MKYLAIALSDIGKVRGNNEDNLYFDGQVRQPQETAAPYRKTLSSDRPIRLLAVCDGMGGEVMGEQASYLAVSGLREIEQYFMKDAGHSFPRLMPRYLNRVNESICRSAHLSSGKRMGSTFSALLLRGAIAQTINIGDSKIFLYRNGQLAQLTVDHTHAQRLLEMGVISEDEARHHPERHRLTQHLGLFPEEQVIQPAISPEIWVQEGDIYLLCSDGITEMLDRSHICELLQSPQSFLQQAEDILQAALSAGGKDNATLILLRIQEVEESDRLLGTGAAASAADNDMPMAYGTAKDRDTAVPERFGATPQAPPSRKMDTHPGSQFQAAAPSAMQAAGADDTHFSSPKIRRTDEQMTDDDRIRFERARQAALQRQNELKQKEAERSESVKRRTNKFSRMERSEYKERTQPLPGARKKTASGPSALKVVLKSLGFMLFFSILGFVLFFALVHVHDLSMLLKKLLGGAAGLTG